MPGEQVESIGDNFRRVDRHGLLRGDRRWGRGDVCVHEVSMEERIPTTERLARALEEAKAPPHMVARARRGEYDDYKSHHPAPIVKLVQDCQLYGLPSIAERAINGEFDGTKEDAEEWASSPEGQEVMQAFGLADPPPNLGNRSGPGPSLRFSKKRRRR